MFLKLDFIFLNLRIKWCSSVYCALAVAGGWETAQSLYGSRLRQQTRLVPLVESAVPREPSRLISPH